jgi:hypothetical protein
MRIVAALAFIPFLIPSAAGAKTIPGKQVYDCKMTSGVNDFIPDQMFIVRDIATQAIDVYDPVINRVVKRPIAAKVSVDTPKRLEIGWTLTHVPLQRGGDGTAIYALTFIKSTQNYYESVIVAGHRNTESTEGHCILHH